MLLIPSEGAVGLNSVMMPGGIELVTGVGCPMRDGTSLSTDLYYPPATAPAPYPVLLLRTPYGKEAAQASGVNTYAHPAWFAANGYIVAVQDVRGRHASEGDWDAFRQEPHDGYDAVEWCARLENASGSVGMYGMSYGGFVQLAAAALSPPSLTCIAPACITPRLDDCFLSQGLVRVALLVSWGAGVALDQARRAGETGDARELLKIVQSPQGVYGRLPLIEQPEVQLIIRYLPFIKEWLTRSPDDEGYWNPVPIGPPGLPALYITGWYDTWSGELIELRNQQEQAGGLTRLVVGPWAHVPWRAALRTSFIETGEEMSPDLNHLHLEWFDWQLKGRPPESWLGEEKALWYDYGSNEWTTGSFGADTVVKELNVWSDGLATVSNHGLLLDNLSDQTEPTRPDVIIDDPLGPTPSIGGWACCYESLAPIGPKDQATVEALASVSVYTSADLGGLCIQGEPRVSISVVVEWVPATLIATLCLVRGGESVNVARGLSRIQGDVQPWSNTELEIALSPVALTLREGDRLRLNLHASSFPEWTPDPHVPGPVSEVEPTDVRAGRIVIEGNGSLMLPVVSLHDAVKDRSQE